MSPQELILSACSSETTATSSARSTSAPAIHLHDLLSGSPVQSFKTSVSGPSSVSYVPTQDDTGGAVFAVQEGKAITNVWAWQKMHLKLHLPEKLSSFTVSPNGCWAAAGSPTGHVYLWEVGHDFFDDHLECMLTIQISSGLLHASFTAHYRAVTCLGFSSDSQLLFTASLDASAHVYLVSRLLDPQGDVHKPYGTLNDHTLGITALAVGRTAGASGGRCWTASEDGTVKMWSIGPSCDLLTTFSLPPGVIPSTLAVEPAERFFYVGTTTGDVYHIPLFRRRAQVGELSDTVEAVGGGGQGAPTIKTDGAVISTQSPVTALSLSLSASHLLVGTKSADIHIHALPSHQHLRTLSSHAGPITQLSTLLRPPDLVGSTSATRSDNWSVIEIKPFERMRVGRTAKDVQEVTMLLRPHPTQAALDGLRPPRAAPLVGGASTVSTNHEDQLAEALAENKRLRASLDRATKINDKMWNGIVDLHLVQPDENGHSST